MKRKFFLFLFLSSLRVFSQLYQPFPADSAMWREGAYSVESSYIAFWNYQYFLAGDTLVAGTNYHKVLKTGIYYEDWWGGGYNSYSNDYQGAYREDTAKRLWFLPMGDTTEYLFYDFNLSLGDTLGPMYFCPGGESWVSGVDSIAFADGTFHKRFHISGDTAFAPWTFDYVQLIEGLGSTFGLLGFISPPGEQQSQLSCFTYQGVPRYPDTATTCTPIIAGLDEPGGNELQFRAFPNPSTGLIQVYSEEPVQIEISDILGKVFVAANGSQRNSVFDLASLRKGIYFLKATSDNGYTATQKIILQ